MNVVSPLAMTRDNALALSRAIGTRVTVTFNDPPGSVTGTVRNVDSTGHLVVDTAGLGGFRIPMASITGWSPVKKGAHL